MIHLVISGPRCTVESTRAGLTYNMLCKKGKHNINISEYLKKIVCLPFPHNESVPHFPHLICSLVLLTKASHSDD